ncbi:MAG: hypothetical protein AB1726_00340 [Planctomycetota bacterium]
MTLIEIVVAFTVLVVAALAFTRVIVYSTSTTGVQREVSLAQEAARQTIEILQAESFAEVFARYNSDPEDDPGVPGTAPGDAIEVPELAAPAGAPGPVGRISFPTAVDALEGLQLRENVVDTALGMPRDLNGDGAVDGLDHSGDYALLPVRIRFEWRGKAGDSALEIKTLLADY